MKRYIMGSLLGLASVAFQPSLIAADVSSLSGKIKETTKKSMDINKLNINNVDLKTLSKVKGIGKSKAKAILEYRKLKGKIKSMEELAKVKGIGKSTLKKLKQNFVAAE